MKKDEEIKAKLGRQVKKFLQEWVTGAYDPKRGKFKTTDLARKISKFYGEEVTKQTIESQLNSPQWFFINYLEEEKSLNVLWLIHGEEDPTLKPIK